jgi:hypothetical protein
LGSEQLQGALGKRSLVHFDPQGHLPPQIIVRPRLGLFVRDPLIGLQQQGVGQQAGGYAGPPIVRTVEGGEVFVPKQSSALAGQEARRSCPGLQTPGIGYLPRIGCLVENVYQACLTPHFGYRGV